MKSILSLSLVLLFASPAFADELKPEIHPPVKIGYWDRHPLVYKLGTPVRKFYHGCIWIGEESKPIQPFLTLCGALGSMASPFVYGFAPRN